MKVLRTAVFVFVALVLSSCVYDFAGKYSSIPGGIKSIYIANINNSTYEPNLQIDLKRYIIDEFNLDLRARLTDKKHADGIVYVTITNYNISPSSFGESGFASVYRCEITVNVSLKKGKEYIIKDRKLSAYKDYSSTDLISATEIARKQTSKDVLKDLASKIKDELFIMF